MLGLERPDATPWEVAQHLGLPPKFDARLAAAYRSYASACPRFDRWFPKADVTDPDRKELQDLYRSNRTALRDAAVAAQPLDSYSRGQCQLCGIGELSDLDHYLGQADFPEFVIHPFNVIPTCGICNPSRRTFDEQGQRRILHLYYDDVSELPQMVRASVVLNKNGVLIAEYSLALTGTSSIELLFVRQWEVLHLKKRYERLAPAKLKTMKRTCDSKPTRATIQKILRDQARDFEIDRGLNDWEVELHRAAAESDDFLTACGAT